MSTLLLVFVWLLSNTHGQFIQERGSSCSDGSLVYSCTTTTSSLVTWRFRPSGARKNIVNGDSSPQSFLVGSSRVLFTIITSNASSISVAASIAYSDAVRLNGTSIQCDTEGTIIINVSDVMTNLPASLKIQRMENIVMIDPTPNIIGVFYSVTSDNIRSGILNGSAIVIQNSNAAFNVSFICIGTSRSFNIGECIFQDYNKKLSYSLFPEMNWKIICFNDSNEISGIMCKADGKWSLPNQCQDEASDKNISPTTETNLSSGTSSGCGNLIAYLVAPLVAVSFALLGNILVMVICFSKKRKKIDMSTEKENNSSQEGRGVNLVDNVAYEYINTK